MTVDKTMWGLVRDARAPLVGRDEEMAVLDRALEAVEKRGETRIVTLVGPGGIGKSRLVQDFVIRHRALHGSLVPRVYRGSARDTTTSFAIFAKLLRARFGLVEGMDTDACKAQVRAQVSKVIGDRKVGDVVYFLGQFLGIPFEESPLTRAVRDDPQQAELIRRAVFRSFLESDASHKPICLVFEDLHAAHDDALALLRYLLEYLSGPILVLCCARPELLSRHEDWGRVGERRHELIELALLREADAIAMMDALLAPCIGGVPPELVDAACSFAAGNPLLLEQMVRIYHDVGVLEEESELSDEPRWRVDLDKLQGAHLPLTIEDAVDARITALEPDERRLLEQAAAMGSVFWSAALVPLSRIGREAPELWTLPPSAQGAEGVEGAGSAAGVAAAGAVAGAGADAGAWIVAGAAAVGATAGVAGAEAFAGGGGVGAASSVAGAGGAWSADPAAPRDEDAARINAMLADLVERDYVLKLPDSTFPGSDEYVFKHNKEREAIQKRTNGALSKRYHQTIAEWLDHQETVRTSEEYIAMLAEHREKGGDAIRAGLAYLEAGDAARKRYASTRASEYYHKGLVLLGDSHAGRRIDALHDYGDVLLLMGRIDDALAAFREMLTLAYRIDLRRKGGAAHNRIGRLYRDIGSLDEAGRHLATGLALFEASGDERGVASSIDDLGKLHWLKGEYDQALTLMRDALARRRRLGDRRSIALSFNNMGLVLQDSGEFKQALEAFEQALLIRRDIGDLVGVVATLNNLGTIAQDQRDFARALALFEEALEVAQQIGDRNRTALVLTNIGECHYRSGHASKAIELLRQAEELCDELGDKLGLAEALRGLGKAYLLQSDLVKARDCIGRAVDLFATVRSKVHLGIALRTLGEITAAGGWGSAHTKSAREYFARSVAIFEQTGNDVELARTFKVYARFLVTEPELASDPATRREAEAMDARAEAIFGRLKISSAGLADLPVPPRDRPS